MEIPQALFGPFFHKPAADGFVCVSRHCETLQSSFLSVTISLLPYPLSK